MNRSLPNLVFRKTLLSVPFGIALMVMIALYIAVGSGFTSVREYFEMNELQFFNAWPLKVLMLLLVVSLSLVTWIKIPFTPPRYGVWMIHSGIIVLISGTTWYYWLKVEGMILIPVGRTATTFYDNFERALYVRAGTIEAMPIPLTNLPRFASYGPEPFARGKLSARGMSGLIPQRFSGVENGRNVFEPLSKMFGMTSDVKLDVIGYYPYASIVPSYIENDPTGTTGVLLAVTDQSNGNSTSQWLSTQPNRIPARATLPETDFEHRHVATGADVARLVAEAQSMHKLHVEVAGTKQDIAVEPGKTYAIGATGYSVSIESFDPAFSAMNGETVTLLTFMVQTPTQKFRRQSIMGRPQPTDWQLGVAGAGPMGKRQTTPLDAGLITEYTWTDLDRLTPVSTPEKKILITSAEPGMTILTVGRDKASTSQQFDDGRTELMISDSPVDDHDHAASGASADHPAVPRYKVQLARKDHFRVAQTVEEVPKAKRNKDEGAGGQWQVVRVRVSSGDWSTEVLVPYSQFACEPFAQWRGDPIDVPGSPIPISLQLGNRRWQLPADAAITVEKFEAEPYPGGDLQGGSVMRDFRSHLRIVDRSGKETRGVAYLNNPVYFGGGSWLFFQAQWDPEKQSFTVLGVGNRAGVHVMTAGCVMIIVGLLYAFYAKPFIIARMKRRAIEEAKERGIRVKEANEPATVGI